MRKPVIAIDGHSSTGKSSISKVIAQNLGLVHIDTGALYRAITLYALRNCQSASNEIQLAQLFSLLPTLTLDLKHRDDELVVLLNDENITREIRENKVSHKVSLIAQQKEVRDFLLDTQRNMAARGGVIMDGRDIGTVILPDADYKFFLTASIEERTKRRFLELERMGMKTEIETVRDNLILRDKTDSEREIAPLRKANDAIEIDNSALTKKETIEVILSYLK